MSTEFTVDYFIQKFQAIPEECWTTETYRNDVGQRCALGFCGYYPDNPNKVNTPEYCALIDLFDTYCNVSVVSVNDNHLDEKFPESTTPKERVLAVLNYIKEKQTNVSLIFSPN